MSFNNSIKKTKTLFKDGFFHIIGSTALNKIIVFASTWILARIINKAEYGSYTYAYNIYSFLFLLNGLGIGSAILQLCSEKNEDKYKDKLYAFGSRFGIAIDVVLMLIIIVVALLVPLPIIGSNELLLLMCGLPVFSILPEMQTYFLRYNQYNKRYSYNNIASSTIILITSISFALVFKSKGIILAGYLSQVIILLVSLLFFKSPIRIKGEKVTTDELKTILGIATISMLNNGLSRLMYLLDIFVLGIVIPDGSVVASYKIATNIPTAMLFIPSAIIIYLYPQFAMHKGNGQWLLNKYKKMIVPFAVFNIAISAFMVIFAPIIIRILFGEPYMDAIIPFRILCVGYFFSATFRSISGNLLVTQRKLRFNLFISIFSGLLNTSLNVVLITLWGSNGAAVATVATAIISGLISTVYLITVFHGYDSYQTPKGNIENYANDKQ